MSTPTEDMQVMVEGKYSPILAGTAYLSAMFSEQRIK